MVGLENEVKGYEGKGRGAGSDDEPLEDQTSSVDFLKKED